MLIDMLWYIDTCVQSVTALALAEKDRGGAESGGPWNQQH